jgi:hypothetical protein
MIADDAAGIETIGEYLDSLPPDGLWAAVANLSREEQRTVYARAKQSRPLELEDFAGPAAALTPVVHRGCNTLPLPLGLRHFVKPFSRMPGTPERLIGYNETPLRRLIGPGYFVAYKTDGIPQWQERGGVVVDYFEVPSGLTPAGWPPVVPNSRGLQRFVYRGTRDFMRRVSLNVTIGAVYKADKPMDHYFVLCRAV